MELGPIWRALLRNKTAYLLIALQMAVTMAIMVNAISIIQERNRLMGRPSGVDEANIFYLQSVAFRPDFDERSTVTADLAAIRSLPGVRDAVWTNSVPLRSSGWSMGLRTEPGEDADGTGAAIYFVDEHGIDTFGVQLTAGRNFLPSEVEWLGPASQRWPPAGIVTRALAETLFPGEADDVVGRTIYINNDQPVQVVGVIERLQAPWNGWNGVERTMLIPAWREQSGFQYVVRTEPGQLDALMPRAEQMLADSNRDRLITGLRTMTETRARSYHADAAMIRLLVFVVSLLTAITALGIAGLASFSVARRTRQIGTRRALGASRLAILRYFMVENFLVSGAGILAGVVFAVGMNIWMVQAFDLTPLAWYMIPAAMIVLWLVGQAAVYGPARRASRVPPAVATRGL